MSALPQALPDAPPQASLERRMRWFELSLVILVSCGTIFLNSLYIFFKGPGPVPQYQQYRWVTGLTHEVASLLLLVYVLSRRNLRLANLGFRWSAKDLLLGLPAAIGGFFAYAIGFLIVSFIHRLVLGSPAVGPNARAFFSHPGLAIIPYVLLNPFFEELIVRAYLMTELLELTGSAFLAVAVSVLVLASYHLYYGWVGAISIGFMFLAFSIFFLKTRRALPIISAHGLIDIYGIFRLW
jgi:membrane protease YdiL (CAAX protease family)